MCNLSGNWYECKSLYWFNRKFQFQANNSWNNFDGCNCLKEILQQSGFDSPEFLVGITELQLNQLEVDINRDRTIVENIKTECVHIKNYKNDQNFKFLPGHRFLILKFSQNPVQEVKNRTFEHPSFSILLQSLIQTALNNYEKPSTNKRYSELLTDFAIYVYIMAGKACYEVISANLPMPSANTICKNNIQNS